MTFHFLIFTITIKKRTYTSEELAQIVRQQQLLKEMNIRLDQYRYLK